MKTVLVTGSNGLLGKKVVDLLLAEGYKVYATNRGKDRFGGYGPYEYASIDITDELDIVDYIVEKDPDFIVNCAASTKVDDCEIQVEEAFRTNTRSVEYITNTAMETGSFLIHVSTDFVFDGKKGLYVETDKCKPINVYGESKFEAEQLILSSNLRFAIIRTCLVYGVLSDMSRSNILLWVRNNLKIGRPIQVVNDQWRTPTLVEDLARSISIIIDKESEGVYHVSGKEYVTPFELAHRTAAIFDLDAELINPTNAKEFKEVGERPLLTGFRIDKAINELGYSPHTLDEGMLIVKDQLKKIEGKFIS